MRSRLPKPTSIRRASGAIPGALIVFFAAACAPAALAEPPVATAAKDLSGLELFQHREDRLFRTGYRLATANAEYCDRTELVPGMLLHDAASYGDAERVRSQFGLSGDIGVQSVVPGSPAALAGIKVNDTLTGFGSEAIAESYPPTRPGWKRLAAIRERMETMLSDGSISLSWSDNAGLARTAVVSGTAACTSRFELIDRSNAAEADGTRVLLGQNFPAFGYSEDEFAAAVAHELAHNILAHVATLDRVGRSQSNIRLSERDADRLMPWLLANAGYAPEAAIGFMEKWGPKYGGGLLRKRTHDGWDERVEYIKAELATLESRRDSNGKADWKSGFVAMLESVPPR